MPSLESTVRSLVFLSQTTPDLRGQSREIPLEVKGFVLLEHVIEREMVPTIQKISVLVNSSR